MSPHDVGPGHPWELLVERMTSELVAAGRLSDPAWVEAMRIVPRHRFVPEHPLASAYEQRAVITQTRPTRASADPGGAGLPDTGRASSSLSAPAAVSVPLDRLDVKPGQRVLEIGTGTGYVAALLAHRLGDDAVVSVELDPELSATAADVLADLDYTPTLITGDGYQGAPGHGPFDRILATCAITHVPPAWITQLAPGGRIVAPLAGNQDKPYLIAEHQPGSSADAGPGAVAGAVVEVTGWFDRESTGFMPLRHDPTIALGPDQSAGITATTMPAYSTTDLDPRRVRNADPTLALLCRLHVPGLEIATVAADDQQPARTLAHTADSYAEVSDTADPDGRYPLLQRGPRRVWDHLETALRLWDHLEHPELTRFGLTATTDPEHQYVWLDEPLGPYSWPLPL